MQHRINQKLDSNARLRDVVEAASAAAERARAEAHADNAQLQQQFNDVRLKVETHDDRMARLNDDKKIFEVGRDQLRNDIKEFEKLCQDISMHNDTNMARVELNFKHELADLRDQILSVEETAERQNYILDAQKERF